MLPQIGRVLRRFVPPRPDKNYTITVTGPGSKEIERLLARLQSPSPEDKDTQPQREDQIDC
jgi:hypothetical protein